MTLTLQFDPSQPHQLAAVSSVVRLFEGLPRRTAEFALGGKIVPNLPPFEELREGWLYDNLLQIQSDNGIMRDGMSLEVDQGLGVEGTGVDTIHYPSFTVEMETGTGKTYVALRTIYELRRIYGFSKFIIVVPSIAIYEGWIKNFDITRDHFRALFSNETVNLIKYDSSHISQLHSFAASTFVEILVITLNSFNKSSNVIFKPSEKLPGKRLPYQYLQETRPILILDEPQNMESDKAHEALRTLHPLFALRYSATHRTTPNLVYTLTPFDAYRLNLVKKIQVFGVTERENFNQPFLALEKISVSGGLKANVRTYVTELGRMKETELVLKHGDDLYSKTKREEHHTGYKVSEVNAAYNFVEFENGVQLFTNETIGPSRPEIFRAQIRKTLEQHMEVQQHLKPRKVKVLSLFFIDRVANYTAPDGLIRRIFDEEFTLIHRKYPFYAEMKAEDARRAYFAKKKPAKGQEEGDAFDTDSRNQAEQDAKKDAFVLIIRDKERLLSFDEKTCFIFAHSALKEGWDNPNVFQICTLNQTVSEIKKRQEIGRGLRLAVNQDGLRVMDEDVNILSVIANESYQSYASRLQTEYIEAGQTPPPAPKDPAKSKARRNNDVYATQAFRDFWAKFQRHTSYRIHVDTPALVKACIEQISNRSLPPTIIVVEKGKFIVTEYTLELVSVGQDSCKIKISTQDTLGNDSDHTNTFFLNADLQKDLRDERLRGFKIVEIVEDGDDSYVLFGNNQKIDLLTPIVFQSEQGQKPTERTELAPSTGYPVFNLIDRAAKETGLTRPTLNQIFRGISDRRKKAIFTNPEGFASLFISEINNALADHIAENIRFEVTPAPTFWGHDLDELFREEVNFPQRELVPASSAGLYDQVQVDSDVEQRFVVNRLNQDDQILFYFKFPPSFKIDFPRIIGNYNPDWGIARFTDGKILLELVRETKGKEKLEGLQFPSEARKIRCAQKHFRAVGIDFRVISDVTANWWASSDEIPKQIDLPK